MFWSTGPPCPRRSPTASCSSVRTKPGSSRATSSTSTADTAPTDRVGRGGFLRALKPRLRFRSTTRFSRTMTMGAPVILITGALTGIGRATAFAFAKEGATVVASGRRETEGKALEAKLGSLGAEAAFIPADVRHEDEVRNLVEQTVARFGRLDVAVNNAGTEGKPGPLAEQTSESQPGLIDTSV